MKKFTRWSSLAPSWLRLLSKSFLLVAVMALLSACSKKTDDNSEPNPEPPAPKEQRAEMSDQLYVVTPKGEEDPIISYDGTTLVLAMDDARSLRAGQSDRYINYNTKQSARPKQGDIIVVPRGNRDSREQLFFRLSSDPTYHNGEMRVITSVPKFEEVTDDINVNETFNLADLYSPNIGTEEEGELEFDKDFINAKSAGLGEFKIERTKAGLQLSQNIDFKIKGQKVTLTPTFEMNPVLNIRIYKPKGKGIHTFVGRVSGNWKIKLDAETKIKLIEEKKKSSSEWTELYTIKLPPIPIANTPLQVRAKMRFIGRIKVSGDVEIKATIVSYNYPFYSEGGYDRSRSKSWYYNGGENSLKPKWSFLEDFSIKAAGSLDTDVRFGVSFQINNFKQVKGHTGVGFNLENTIKAEGSKKGGFYGSFTTKPSLYLYLGFELDIAKWFEYTHDKTIPLYEFEEQDISSIVSPPKSDDEEEVSSKSNTTFFDDFNQDEIDLVNWEKPAYPSAVKILDGVLQLEQTVTDAPIELLSKHRYRAKKYIELTRKVMLYKANDNYYPGLHLRFSNKKHLEINYVYSSYANTYKTTIVSYDAASRKPLKEDKLADILFNVWFDERIYIDVVKEELHYYRNGSLIGVIRIQGLSLSKPFQIRLHPYGWYTGHKYSTDNFRLVVSG